MAPALTPRQRALLLLLGAVATAHVAVFGWWLVEDAAISFAYARNWADGHGLVPYVGGERVEGYSNFLWVVLLAAGELVGVNAFVGAKALSFALTAATVPLVFRLGERAGGASAAGLLAAAAYAVDTQVAIFGAAGLENPLFSFLLAAGLLRADDEARTGDRPWSALLFLAIALTRPEGILYAAVAGALALATAVRARRGPRRIAEWLALFFAPFLTYHLVRYAYFAWPFPMTFYAKVDEGADRMLAWGSRGWTYLRGWVTDLHRLPFLPLVVLGRLGPERGRWALAAVLGGGALLLLPEAAGAVRPVGWGLLLLALALPGFGLPRDGVRAACGAMALASVFFAVYAQGDWMGGYRWLSFASVPLAVLLGAALADLPALAPARARAPALALAGALLVGFATANGVYTKAFLENPEISPYLVRARVVGAEDRAARLHLDERPSMMTVDLGGFMWWSDMELVDLVGLVDVTFAQHDAAKGAVIDEYVLEERRPHFVIVGQAWGERLLKMPKVRDAYVALHGNHSFVRRDLLFAPGWTGTSGRAARFERGVRLAGVEVPSPEVAVGSGLYVEVGLVNEDALPYTARLLLADAAGRPVASWPIQPAYNWVPASDVRPDEVFHGRFTLALPPDLPEGRYALGVRVAEDGQPLAPVDAPIGARVADDTVWFADLVTVVSDAAAREAAEADLREARGHAAEGRCTAARDAWRAAKAHRPTDRAFAEERWPEIERRLAACWIARADADPAQAVDALEQARRLDPDAPGLAERIEALADRRYAEGLKLREEERWRKAFTAFLDVVRLDPSRSWARRYAEEARKVRLRRGRRDD